MVTNEQEDTPKLYNFDIDNHDEVVQKITEGGRHNRQRSV